MAQKSVVHSPVQTAQPAGMVRFLQLRNAMKNGVHQNQIRIESVDSRREDDLGLFSARELLPPTGQSIQTKPGEKLHEVRSGKRADAMPSDLAAFLCPACGVQREAYVADALRVEFNFIFVIGGEAVHQFGDCALGAVLAIDEWGNHGDPHVIRLRRSANQLFLDDLAPIHPLHEYSAQLRKRHFEGRLE